MVLHPSLEVKSFDTYGFACRGLFVKSGCRIRKGERVWWLDRRHDATVRSYTKHGILTAPMTANVASSTSSSTMSPPDRSCSLYNGTPSMEDLIGSNGGDDELLLTYPNTPPSTPISNNLPPLFVKNDRCVSLCTLTSIENLPELPFPSEDGVSMSKRNPKIGASRELPLPTLRSKNSTTDTTVLVSTINPREILVTYSYMMDDDLYISTTNPSEDVSFFYNHSCDANTAYANDDLVVALRDIGANEQVVYDYAFTETQDSLHFGLQCRCGAAACRGKLDFLQYKDPVFIAAHYQHCTSFIQRKMRENGWVHENVVRRRVFTFASSSTADRSNEQYGLVARSFISRGTPILMFAGKIVSGQYIESISRREQEMCLQIDHDLWQIPNRFSSGELDEDDDTVSTEWVGSFETGDYINHSCRPNCGMLDAIRVVTMRDIDADEAVTIDYAMVTTGVKNVVAESFECHCSSMTPVACTGFGTKENDPTTSPTPVAPHCRQAITAFDYQTVGATFLEYLSPFVRDAYAKHANRVVAIPSHATNHSVLSPLSTASLVGGKSSDGEIMPSQDATPCHTFVSTTGRGMSFALGGIQHELDRMVAMDANSQSPLSPMTPPFSTFEAATASTSSLSSVDLRSTPTQSSTTTGTATTDSTATFAESL